MTEQTFIIRRKPNWFVLILTGLWSLGWFGLFLTIVYGFITDPDKIDGELILFMLIFLVAGLFIFKIFLWQLRGQERITLSDKELIIRKKGTFLTVPRRFELETIESVSDTMQSKIPGWMIFWGLGGGVIEIVYLGNAKYFGQTISKEQSKAIIEAIKEKIKARDL